MSGPVTVEMLRDDWRDNPNLSEAERVELVTMPDALLSSAIESAFADYEDMWYAVLDRTREAATDRLLSRLATNRTGGNDA